LWQLFTIEIFNRDYLFLICIFFEGQSYNH
jgi:hypothetical protein